MKKLFIAEKPSVAKEFAKALGVKNADKQGGRDGYIETESVVVTWCVGHLVNMSYPEVYNPNLKKWSMSTIPFIPDEYKYEVLPGTLKQFNIVKQLLNRDDVDCIYVCTDSGREGEYIYRLVDDMAGVSSSKEKRRVWIDSQTEEEILRGIKDAKLLSEYNSLSDAAYLRAQEDYLMGINFSRVLTLKYSQTVKNYLKADKCVIAVGRVMTCVLGMIVKREREIRDFKPVPFYRIVMNTHIGENAQAGMIEAEWKAVKGSRYFESPELYKENGFRRKSDAEQLICILEDPEPLEAVVDKVEKKTEKKAPPLLYNLAELQNDCSQSFKITPSDTLAIVQELYEKKLVTYPRTDARVLSSAVAKEIGRNLSGLRKYKPLEEYAGLIVDKKAYTGVAKSKYVNDKQITDHYAIIPTGQGFGALGSASDLAKKVYDKIARRFLSIFYPVAEYEKISLTLLRNDERFFSSFKRMAKPGYLIVANPSLVEKEMAKNDAGSKGNSDKEDVNSEDRQKDTKLTPYILECLSKLKKGSALSVQDFVIKEGETTPPKRYNTGSLILAMENAGQLIENEELRGQIKGSGIGTSATRDSIITKLINNKYISLNKKTQIVTPSFLGEIIYDVVYYSINNLLRAEMTASWEKGLEGVAEGTISKEIYTQKMNNFVIDNTELVKKLDNQFKITYLFDQFKPFYIKGEKK